MKKKNEAMTYYQSKRSNEYMTSWGKKYSCKGALYNLRRLEIFLSFENDEVLLIHAKMIDDVKVNVKIRHNDDGVKVTLALRGIT